MSKELTEQWRNGTLPEGYYYIKTRWLGCDNKWHYNKEQDIDYLDSDCDWCGVANNSVVEIIGDVPTYDEYKRLQEQLKDADYILKNVFISDAYYKSKRAQYLEKWGVK